MHTLFFRLYCMKLAQLPSFCQVALHCFFAHMQLGEPLAVRGSRLQSFFFFASVQDTLGPTGPGVGAPGPGAAGPGPGVGAWVHTPVSLACW